MLVIFIYRHHIVTIKVVFGLSFGMVIGIGVEEFVEFVLTLGQSSSVDHKLFR